jgi:hypothetical protein
MSKNPSLESPRKNVRKPFKVHSGSTYYIAFIIYHILLPYEAPPSRCCQPLKHRLFGAYDKLPPCQIGAEVYVAQTISLNYLFRFGSIE